MIVTVSTRTSFLHINLSLVTRSQTQILCRYHIDFVISFTEIDVDGENPVYSMGLTNPSNDTTLRELLSKKICETRPAIPFDEWNDEWKKKKTGNFFLFPFVVFVLIKGMANGKTETARDGD